MREDPIISGGVVKALLVLLVAGALGVGGYALAGGGIDIDLPDLPDLDTLGEEGGTTVEETTLENTTIDSGAPADSFTSAFFADALDKVRDEVGPGQRVTRVFINTIQAQFIVLRGEEVEAYSVRADRDEISSQEATVTITGDAELEDFAFALDAIDAAAVDRMLAAAAKQSGASDLEPTVLSLERAVRFGRRALEWTISAEADGESVLYRAGAGGGKVRDQRAAANAPAPPTGVEDAQRLNECIQKAGGDNQKILACLER